MPPSRFAAYADLLDTLVSRGAATCERIERRLLNAKDKPISRVRERQQLAPVLTDCFFEDLPRQAALLCDQLAAAHVADGFEPFLQRGHPHQLDAAEAIVRAYAHWERTRWPGVQARLQCARSVWMVFLLRHLQDLSLRIWDEATTDAAVRLREVQRLLDAINAAAPDAVLVRDARWLIQIAQGPLTKGLTPYFRVARHIAESFAGADAIAIHGAGAKLAGGHLRSQVRHRSAELGRPADSAAVLGVTRNSNAMDVALLVWDLIPLLEAYGAACATEDGEARRSLADAILQGMSADPDLLLVRLDLLGPCTAIETVFVDRADGQATLTATGIQHAARLIRYAALVNDLASPLAEDAARSEQPSMGYSPLAMVYGFCGDLLANLALASLRGAATHVTLEELFVPGGDAAAKQARAGVEFPPGWAGEVLAATRAALHRRAASRGRLNASETRSAHIVLSTAGEPLPADAQEFCVTSDVNVALATGATAFPRGQIVTDRHEGRFLGSAETDGRWFGVSKMVLTDRLAQGSDARLVVPQDVADILRLTCLEITCSA